MSTPRTDEYGRDTRFQIDRHRRWMVSEYLPDAGDGCPGTRFRDPTDEEWAAVRPAALDEDMLAQILDGYRLNRSEYFSPVVAADNTRLETTREWAHRIAVAYAERVTKGSSPDSEQVDSER